MSRIIIGIDPGTNFMGYAILEVELPSKKPKLLVSGVLEMSRIKDTYLKLNHIFNRTLNIIDEYKPNEFAIESQFFGKNVQSMLKLGRAQGVAIAAALQRGIPIFEYAPLKIKMSVTGTGSATKEQIALMIDKLLNCKLKLNKLDETDAIAIAYCHYLQSSNPLISSGNVGVKSWSDYVKQHPESIAKNKKL